ncbi:nitric oxide dioxygenase [Sinomonas atrocyanea]|uniref:globin domain-containing protein n=1 Tax=Sinomonas atrocyanea TaxID=37927 RepID=UPI0027879D5B|nr:globin domain-containing protein [Sinomonas atrocyanea]MDQ0259179.1 nitric oxide dioxygenase [Sinomonas atrocyanea]
MLSETSAPIIKATLPAVGENIQTIAQRFYDHLFQAHPELFNGVFNRGNQADGQQQQALAGSVAAYASMLLERPGEVPEALLSRISHKHAALAVTPQQYEVVHEHLFWAIADVLGEAVTPEVAAAWDEVYWLMANTLMNLERGLYADFGGQPENIWRTWRVVEKRPETDDVVTIVVERTDERDVYPSQPGQYVTVQMPTKDRLHQPRQYSLTRADDGHHRTFAVKRVHDAGRPEGEVSTLIHDSLEVGDELILSAPFGDVVLAEGDGPVVFASAGIGVTPFAGMLSHLAARGSQRQVLFLHAGASPDSFPLRDQVSRDLGSLPNASLEAWFELPGRELAAGEHEGFMDLSAVELPADATYYLCGPLPFMKAVRSQLIGRGTPAQKIQYEVFGPDLWQADTE